MNEKTLIAFVAASKAACVLAAIAGAIHLADQGKDGWGWMIFLAIMIGSFSITYRKDTDDK
jgi:hypothetical protein